jgi:membrane-bound lytic murein transglycosylase D
MTLFQITGEMNKNRQKPIFWLLTWCFFVLFLPFQTKAQESIDSLIANDLEFFQDHYQDYLNQNSRIYADTTYAKVVPGVDMETIEDRASCLELDLPLVINKTVCGFIHFFTVRKRNYTQTMLERKNYYFPIFEYYLKKHNMPDALKYLAIVESGLKFNARSRTGAVGLWQFMPGTGKDFYLAQNQHIDERQHPYLATEAACKFLKYLYGMFNDWELALAAYNCGPGNVMKAMRKSGRRGFWEIYNFLPQETRSYVPQFHAVVYSMNFANEHNIKPDLDSIWVTTAFDTFQVQKSVDLVKLENILGLPEKSLGTHNPYIKSKVYPANCPHPLLVPKTHGSLLAANLDRFIDSAAVTQWEEDASRDRFVRANGKWKFYKARKGEILEDIADKNGIALASLKKWNHLQGNKTKKAVRLKIFIPSSDPHKIENNQEETQAIAKPETEKKKDFFNEKPVDLEAETHVVKKGEKLYQVAIQYGLTMAQLRKLNHLPSSKINEGQVLNLRKEVENQPEVKVQEVAIAEPIAQDSKTVIYEVQKGDRLFALSKKFNISVSKLRALNQLETDVLKTGQVLKVSEPELNLCKEENVDSAALVQVSEPESKTIKKSEGKSKPKAKEVKLEMAKVYLVQKGDTLYSISKKFASLSIKDIIRLNKLKNKNIKPGQQLIIG